MNCEDFRRQITAGDNDLPELERHLDDCQACARWLEQELATAPQGLSQAEWLSATSRCMPDLAAVNVNTEEITDPEPVKTGFLSGLKYGLAFGLSIITALAVLDLGNRPNHREEKQVIGSFVERPEQGLPSFIEKDFSDVTFFEFRDSKLVSFIEAEKIPSFIEENQEDISWTESESG